jgi:hypothetical protein
LLLATTALALALDASLADRSPWGVALGVLTGVLVPYAGFLVHEWGHLAGTLLSGGRAHPPETRCQFLAMSYAGYLATLGVIGALALWIDPSRVSGQLSLALSSVVGIGVTFAREVPTTWRVARGGPLPAGGVYRGTPPV